MSKGGVFQIDLEKYVNEMRRQGLVKEKRTDYVTLCPQCYEEHRKHGEPNYRNLKLYIDKDLQYSHCFRCGAVYLSDDQSINTSIKRIEEKIDMNNWVPVKLGEEGYWKLSKFYTFDEFDEEGIYYLTHKRLYIYNKLYKLLGIRFHNHNPVTPFYIHGELVFYQIRNKDYESSDKDSIKYFTPPVKHKIPYIIETGDNTKFTIVEGVYDAIAAKVLYPDRTPFAVLGSDITDYQIAMLRTYCPEDILIYMDKTEISRRIKDRIIEYINYADININPSDGTDPEEFLKHKLVMQAEESEYD
jgi:hypothetical protein